MSREELVEAYQDGRINRRDFVRRLMLAGVSLSAAMVYAQALGAAPAHAAGGPPPRDFYCEPGRSGRTPKKGAPSVVCEPKPPPSRRS